MATDETRTPNSLDQLSRAQLEIYAKEIKEHYLEECHLRQELEDRNRQMEQKVREITALNQLFQKHLAER